MHYNDLTRHHFERAVNAGLLSGPHTRRGAAGSRAQGTWVQFDVQFDADDRAEPLRAVRFLAYGCPHVIAVADWIAGQAAGRQRGSELPDSVKSLRARFDVPIEKVGRLLIIEDAWRAAVSSPDTG
ncbi:MAG: hypothetical protein M3O41_17435 [Pseudomonadota bacterium]|nr:hypothetical protein [Pseudomonadota bacterium]